MSAENEDAVPSEGSWLPLAVVVLLIVIRWLCVGTSKVPVRFRRFFHMQVRRWLFITGNVRTMKVIQRFSLGHQASTTEPSTQRHLCSVGSTANSMEK